MYHSIIIDVSCLRHKNMIFHDQSIMLPQNQPWRMTVYLCYNKRMTYFRKGFPLLMRELIMASTEIFIRNNCGAILYWKFQDATYEDVLDASFMVVSANPNKCLLMYKLIFVATLFKICLLAFINFWLSLCDNVE